MKPASTTAVDRCPKSWTGHLWKRLTGATTTALNHQCVWCGALR